MLKSKKTDELKPSNKSASRPEPEPSLPGCQGVYPNIANISAELRLLPETTLPLESVVTLL